MRKGDHLGGRPGKEKKRRRLPKGPLGNGYNRKAENKRECMKVEKLMETNTVPQEISMGDCTWKGRLKHSGTEEVEGKKEELPGKVIQNGIGIEGPGGGRTGWWGGKDGEWKTFSPTT